MTCEHEKVIPPVNENMYPPNDNSWNFITLDKKYNINMCKKCHLVYWEENNE
ncbi:hypothetical protein LCGC14_0677100 [marine sediment metagenome]|uniref:Uncharacterized protein n=1 Tax=marine sediment metagenome TaxID=412755 RepID=A0A0F9TAN8_9ZZZZ